MLIPPAIPATLQQQSVVPGHSLGWGNALVNGVLYATSCCAAAGTEENYLCIWPNPLNPSVFTAVDLGVNKKLNASVAIDTVNNCAYVGVVKASSSSMTIYKVTLDSSHTVSTLVNAVALGTFPNNWQNLPTGAICTDGTHIFAVANSVGSQSWIFSFSCVDGSLSASYQWSTGLIPNPWEATAVAVYDSTHLVVGGSYGWMGRIDKALTTEAAATWTNGAAASSVLQTQQALLVIGGNVWTSGTNTAGTTLSLWKWDGSSSTTTEFPTGLPFLSETSWSPLPITYDGQFIWCVHDSLGRVLKFDPVGGTFVGEWDEISALRPSPGEVWCNAYGVGSQYVAIAGLNFDALSVVALGSEGYPTVFAQPLVGRGAAC